MEEVSPLRIALKSYRQGRQLRVMLKIYSATIMKLLNTSLLRCVIVDGFGGGGFRGRR